MPDSDHTNVNGVDSAENTEELSEQTEDQHGSIKDSDLSEPKETEVNADESKSRVDQADCTTSDEKAEGDKKAEGDEKAEGDQASANSKEPVDEKAASEEEKAVETTTDGEKAATTPEEKKAAEVEKRLAKGEGKGQCRAIRRAFTLLWRVSSASGYRVKQVDAANEKARETEDKKVFIIFL